MPEEGSVDVDGYDEDIEDVDGDETAQDAETIDNQDQAEPEPSEADAQQAEAVQTTDKGTKLDPNPMSALNQQLANERARMREYEAFLSDPAKVEAYLSELRKDGSEPAKTQGDRIDPTNIQTVEDLQKFASQLESDFQGRTKQLEQKFQGFDQVQRQRETRETVASDIHTVRHEYPELRSTNPDGKKNPDFIPELDEEVGRLFQEFNIDPQTGEVHNKVPLKRIADSVMTAYRRGQTIGSEQTQTVVKDKRIGRVTSGSTTGTTVPDESNMSAAAVIASRMKAVSQRR